MSIQLKFDKDDEYVKTYGDKYTNKLNFLANEIEDPIERDHEFTVFNFEAGLGKSRTVDEVLHYLINTYSIQNKYLIVKRFNEESIKSAEFIRDDMFSKEWVLTITADNWPEWRTEKGLENLQFKKVIFISHQRYINLCENEKYREAFARKRDMLIIDEKVNFPIYTYNDAYFMEVMKILPHHLRDELGIVTKEINDYLALEQAQGNVNKCFTVKFKKTTSNTLSNFEKLIQNHLDNYTIKEHDHREKIKEFIYILRLIYTGQCIYNLANICTYNPLHKHWGLKHNFILDASASIDGVYSINPNKYHIQRQTRIIDHSQSKFYRLNFNSSKTNLNQNSKDYYTEITQKILERKQENDKTLIICHRSDAKTVYKYLQKNGCTDDEIWIDKLNKETDAEYNNQSIAISWYGNLIGKNWAKDFTQVWLVSTPNILAGQYLIQYLHYANNKIGNKSTQIVKGRFKNELFKSVQIGYIASEMYQSIKRIQRTAMPKGEFYIVNHDDEVVRLVLSQIKNVSIEDIELDFVKKKEEEKETNKKPTQVDIFIEWILEKSRGQFTKKDIAKELGIAKINRVLTDVKVKSLVIGKIIKVENKYIERL